MARWNGGIQKTSVKGLTPRPAPVFSFLPSTWFGGLTIGNGLQHGLSIRESLRAIYPVSIGDGPCRAKSHLCCCPFCHSLIVNSAVSVEARIMAEHIKGGSQHVPRPWFSRKPACCC